MAINEQNLISALQNGDETAFATLYDNYSAALYGIVLKVVNDNEIANDVLQDAFVKIWKNINKYDSHKGRLFTWMLNIARNTAIDKLRQINRKREIHKELSLVDKPTASENANNINANMDVSTMMKTLSDDQQSIIDLVYLKGHTQAETAKKLNIPLGTVKTRIRIAFKALRNYLN